MGACLLLVFLLAACSSFRTLPRKPGENARVVNLWPVYRSVQDEERRVWETQWFWPIYKYRRVDDSRLVRVWPFWVSMRVPAYEATRDEGPWLTPIMRDLSRRPVSLEEGVSLAATPANVVILAGATVLEILPPVVIIASSLGFQCQFSGVYIR
ncbi:hypothetical protein HQ520_03645 [bacterium]|nr:hypothetical protein [bacterium]